MAGQTPGRSAAERLHELRRRAEERLSAGVADRPAMEAELMDLRRLVHELEVHQVELQLQNEELQQAQLALEAARDRYRALYELAPVGYVTIGADGRIVEANLTATTMLGTPRKALLGRPLPGFFVDAEDADAFHLCLRRALQGAAPEAHTGRLRRTDGSELFARLQLTGEGQPVVGAPSAERRGPRARVALIDVTDDRRREARMRRLATVVEDSSDAVAVLDLQGRILAWNRGAEAIYGLTEAEARGSSIYRLIPAELQAEMRQLMGQLAGGVRVAPFETRRRARDGHTIDVRLAASVLLDGAGRPSAVSTTEQDITERKQILQALQRSETRLRAMIDSAVDGIVTVDEHGTIESFSVRAEQLFGRCRAEVLGRRVDELFRPRREGREAPGASSPAGPFPFRGRGLGRRADGAEFPVHVAVSELGVGDRRVFAGFFRDLTIEDRLKRELVQTQKMEAIGRLAAAMAHDFNNLLTGLIGCFTLAIDSEPTSGGRAHLEQGLEAAKRGASIARRILSFGRRAQDESPPLVVDRLIAGAEGVLGPLLSEGRLRLDLGCPDAAVRVDAGELTMALINLVSNARAASPEGSAIVIETRPVGLECDRPCAQSGRCVQIAVCDAGSGMEEQTRLRVFEPFFTTKKEGDGAGLGLWTVFSLVQRLDGQVRVDSEPGHGTTVTLCLPRVDRATAGEEQATEEQREGSKSQPGMAAGLTALVVEDEALVRWALKCYLEELGYEVIDAGDAEAALGLCDEHPGAVDLLVTDVALPGAQGRALAAEVGRRHPGVRTLFISAYPAEHLVSTGRLAAGAALLPKPFDKAALFAALESL